MGQQWGRAGQPASSLKPLGEYTNTVLDYYMLYIISAEQTVLFEFFGRYLYKKMLTSNDLRAKQGLLTYKKHCTQK
jgi:hypothetical protein